MAMILERRAPRSQTHAALVTQVKLPDGTYVNPAYVTCIELDGHHTTVWIVKDAGYHTGRIRFPGDQRAELAALLNREAK